MEGLAPGQLMDGEEVVIDEDPVAGTGQILSNSEQRPEPLSRVLLASLSLFWCGGSDDNHGEGD